MNPILLKPQGNLTSQIVLNGVAVGTYRAGEYYERWFAPAWQAVKEALARLQQQYDWILCEGAGSPAEVNLKHRDLANMRVALHLGSPLGWWQTSTEVGRWPMWWAHSNCWNLKSGP